MKLTIKKIVIPILISIGLWLLAFFIIGWTQISEDPAIQDLYLPMVVIFGLFSFVFTIAFLWWYLPNYLMIDLASDWLRESFLFGLIITLVQFFLDILIFSLIPDVDLLVYFFGILTGNPEGSTTIIMYPLITVWAIFGGYFVKSRRS